MIIPNKINLLPEISTYSVIEKPISTAIKKGHIGIAFARLLAKIHYKIKIDLNSLLCRNGLYQ